MGSVRIGVARSDPAGILATPLETVRRGKGDLDRIAELVTEYEAFEVIVGLPTSLSGREGPAAGLARDFAAALAERLAALLSPELVRIYDERLTTVTAENRPARKRSPRSGPPEGGRSVRRGDHVAGGSGRGKVDGTPPRRKCRYCPGSPGKRMSNLDLFEEPAREGHLAGQQIGRRAQRSARKRQRRRRMTGRAAVMFALAFLVAVVGGGGLLGYAALHNLLETPDYKGQGTGAVIVQIKDGDFGQTIGKRLKAADVVKSSDAYVNAAKKEPKAQGIQPGFYKMRKQMSGTAALALLLDPKSRSGNQIVVPEGKRVSEVFKLLAKKTGIPAKDFEAVKKNPPSDLGLPSYAKGKLEGFLWPGRYDLDPKNGTAKSIVKEMVKRFNTAAEDMDLEGQAERAGLKPEDVMSAASIIQAESGKPSDMPKISQVIKNRLAKKMQLQMDSTVMYALNKFGIAASSKDLNAPGPYNTYRNHGLPPGPISNPGEKAIDAVFKPKAGPWLYFVTTDPGQGLTEFAVTQAEHDRLAAKLNKYLKDHPGQGN